MSTRLSVRRDDELNASLALLASAGWTPTEAVRYALAILADAHTGAYEAGVTAVGQPVDVVATTVQGRVTRASDAA